MNVCTKCQTNSLIVFEILPTLPSLEPYYQHDKRPYYFNMWCKYVTAVQIAIEFCKNRSSLWKAACVFLSLKKQLPPLCPLVAMWAVLPVVLFLAADLEAVIKREGLVSVPVCQFYTEGILSLAGQLVNVLVPQPVLRRNAPKALKRRKRNNNQCGNSKPFF